MCAVTMVFYLTVIGLNIVLKNVSVSVLVAFIVLTEIPYMSSVSKVNLANICYKKMVQMVFDM